jgi:hypothetical protein
MSKTLNATAEPPEPQRVTWTMTVTAAMPLFSYQLNGHRCDCRCVTCRPDIFRFDTAAAMTVLPTMGAFPTTTAGVGPGYSVRWP